MCLSLSGAFAQSADFELQRSLDLARSQQFEQARQALVAATQRFPSDKRFPIELAGLSFRSNANSEAIRYLREALRLDPADEYANNFLASLYLLEGNLDAAVKYWNRIGKPQINEIHFEPKPRLNPVLLDRNFTFSPASVLRLDDLKTTEARLQSLEVLSAPQYSLDARPDGFDFVVRTSERNGFGNSKAQALVRLFRGLPYQTIYPEYFNIGGTATNVTSLLRWDSNKRRAFVSLSAPLKSKPSFRYRFSADFRDENWFFWPDSSFHSRQFSFGASIDQIVSAQWNWGVGAFLVHDRAPQLVSPDLATEGYSLQYRARLEHQFLYLPERRLTISARLSPTLGRNLTASSTFGLLQASTDLNWLPGRRPGDYELNLRFSGGRSFGTLPFSSLFMLGIERDNDLLLRGHVGTLDGRKGSAPLTRDYLLANADLTRRVLKSSFFDVRLGPFVDIARPYRAVQSSDLNRVLVDPGIMLKLRVLGAATVTLTYGRNLHQGRGAFYASALQ